MYPDLFGSKTAEGVVLYLCQLGRGHSRGIATKLGLSPSQVDRTMKRFESAGLVVGSTIGRTRLYELNPRLPFKKELIALSDRFFEFMSEEERGKYIERRRPRRSGKTL